MDNPRLHLAESFVLHTRQNLFLTGRAGTGKTTFLKQVLQKTTKKYMIVAPTGVAAINAGGITIHSLFQFPLTAFTPDAQYVDFNLATNRTGLLRHLRYSRDKKQLLRELQLLVIDEISMVRCDLLDAIDFALRKTRDKELPFGGVQLLVIGDLFQLAPVVPHGIWDVLRIHYESPYFFAAKSWDATQPVTLELTKIYRQNEQTFIDILNRMRYGRSLPGDFDRLNQQFRPGFTPGKDKFVTLTTHNHKADRINQEEMRKLKSPVRTYSADVVDQFSENAYPADQELQLKEGAQVMFIRNDAEGRYYNGKLAEVTRAEHDILEVTFPDSHQSLQVEKVTWHHKNYELDPDNHEIREKVLGSFSQYPLRLAWAITVHKSQGLTFDRVIVDLGDAFATGQAYVALSRCTSLDGLVLKSRLHGGNVLVNDQIIDFHDQAPAEHALQQRLEQARMQYAADTLRELFDFSSLFAAVNEWNEDLSERSIPEQESAIKLGNQLLTAIREMQRTGQNFQSELFFLLEKYTRHPDVEKLKERCGKAVDYFTEFIYQKLILPVNSHLDEMAYKTRVKKYLKDTREILQLLWIYLERLYQIDFLGEPLHPGDNKFVREHLQTIQSKAAKPSSKKGATYEDTLTLFRSGKSLEEIAKIRSLALSTIESHLSRLIRFGEISVYAVLDRKIIDNIFSLLKEHPEINHLTEIKRMAPDALSFGELRMILSGWQHLQATPT
ncbi:MAG: helix-turn-helix domain-containing protein [Saprospiraceae bacterium]|nr:helix-turn-helix domain-containing protein [Saprospiraceae bacterium]